MIELPLFVSYRQSDGAPLARWLRRHLHGRTFSIGGKESRHVTASVHVDQCVPAVADWAAFHNVELSRAAALIALCTPHACLEKPEYDWLYRELRWWTDNRNEAPVLIRPAGVPPSCVPSPICDAWPKAENVQARISTFNDQEDTIQRIIGGIRLRVRDTSKLNEIGPAYDAAGLFTWEKDKHFRYIRCNENYAAAAGLDSPHSIIGKSDDDMPWRTLADAFRTGDHAVMTGIGPRRFHVQEKEIMVDRNADILVTETQLIDNRGDCLGVTGYFIDITGRSLIENPQSPSSSPHDIRLGGEFEGQVLSSEDASVAVDFLRGLKTRDQGNVNASQTAEFESRVNAIKSRLQCRSDGELAASLIRSGIPLQLLAPSIVEQATRLEGE